MLVYHTKDSQLCQMYDYTSQPAIENTVFASMCLALRVKNIEIGHIKFIDALLSKM